MKKLLILVNKKGPKKKLFTRIISQNLGSDVQVSLGKFADVTIEINESDVKAFITDFEKTPGFQPGDESNSDMSSSLEETPRSQRGEDVINGNNFKEFDLVYFRRIDHSIFPLSGTLALCLDKLGVKYFDTKFREIGAAGDKVTSLVKLALSGVSVPKTLFVTREKILEDKEKIISMLGLPLIAKDTQTQGNKGVYVIKKKEDFSELLNLKKERLSGTPIQFLLQEFINIDKEYRLLVLKDKVVSIHKKDKRSYDKLAVDYEVHDLPIEFVDLKTVPDSLKEAAVKAAQALNVEIGGVDGLLTKEGGKPVILEVNRGPGIEYDTKKSPEMDEIAKFFKRELEDA